MYFIVYVLPGALNISATANASHNIYNYKLCSLIHEITRKKEIHASDLMFWSRPPTISIKCAAVHARRMMEGCWSSMGTVKWFPISSCSSSLPSSPSGGEREVPWPVGGGGALITDAQQGPMAVAPAAGHLGASLTPTLSKNKKIRKGKWGHN